MRTKPKRKSRLTSELLETAKGMQASGVMDNATYDKIAMRHWDGEGARVADAGGASASSRSS